MNVLGWYGPVKKNHDKKVWVDSNQNKLFKPHEFGLADKAYRSLDVPELICPFKGKDLPYNKMVINSFINRNRVLVEIVIGHIKIFRILKDCFRNRVALHPKVFGICVNIYQIKIRKKKK
ncbi:hypothetical protein ACTFIZ_010673 [Dictyostelium cf. discoideum]